MDPATHASGHGACDHGHAPGSQGHAHTHGHGAHGEAHAHDHGACDANDLPCAQEGGCCCGCEAAAAEEGMRPYKKAFLAVAGVFVACGLIAEHVFDSGLLVMVFSGIAIAAALVIVLPETIESLKARSIDINVLMVVAVIGAVYVRAYEEAAAVLFLFSVGEYLEGRALRKSNDAIKDLAKLAPDTALVLRDGAVEEVATDQVKLGEVITVKPGMSVPLDGVITKGASSFNDAAITGESTLVHKGVGETVFAGSLALDGACLVQTSSTVADSTLAKIASLVAEAQKQKSTREHFVQRFAKVYTPLVIVAAVLVAVVPPALSALGVPGLGDVDTWIYRACELLVISCPCAFVISTPVTFVSALTRAAKLGVLVKGGAFFEEGARVTVAAFDKTGTLTEGRPVVVKAIPFYGADGVPEPSALEGPGLEGGRGPSVRLVEIACTLEAHSTHPLGEAVIAYAEQFHIKPLDGVDMVAETAGKGIVGHIEGVRYAIGSQAYLERDLGIGKAAGTFDGGLEQEEGTALLVARLDPAPVLLGAFIVSDALRDGTASVLEALHKAHKGIKTVMLTGDNPHIAASIAGQAGIEEVHAALLPQDKALEIRRLQEKGDVVAFAGDGINDAPSLASADIGIAMGGAGSAAALSSADVVLMADDLSALPKFFSLSRKTVLVLKENVAGAIGLKVLVALLVVIGVAQMWMAVLADTGVSLLVILNGMRLLRTRL